MKKMRVYTLFILLLLFALPCSPLMSAGEDAKSPFGDNVVVTESESKDSTAIKTDSADSILDDKKDGSLPKEGVVSAGELNVRNYPWGDIIGTLKKGDKVKIVGSSGDWYKIEYKESKTGYGYIQSAYVDTPGKKGKEAQKYGTVNSPVKISSVPSSDKSSVVGSLKQGDKVEILGESGNYYRIASGKSEGFVNKKYIDLDGGKSSSGKKNVENFDKPFMAYVTASALNVRSSPWGKISATLSHGTAVRVLGKVGIWYKIDYNGKIAYMPAKHIDKKKPGKNDPVTNKLPKPKPRPNPSPSPSDPVPPSAPGTLQQKIAKCARALLGSTNFRGPEVDGGNLACAQVATTALKNAGALDQVYLNCTGSVNALKAKGWVEVKEPFREGDVITWTTYLPGDSHIGIIVKEGNGFQAMNNSSSKRMPRLSDPHSMKICRILRKY